MKRPLSRVLYGPSLLFVIGGAGCAPAAASSPQSAPDIDAAEVRRVITTLASDEMRGRGAFSEDALRAADFLASEFSQVGLQSPEGADGYLQRFSTRTMTARVASVVIDGRPLTQDRIAVRMGAESLRWSTGDVPVVVVRPEDQPMAVASSVLNGAFDALIILSDYHGEAFRQLVQIFRRPIRSLADAAVPSVVLAMVEADEGAAYEIRATATVQEEPLANVIGTLPGRRSDEYVLFSAHYDHLGIQRPDITGDSIANGANDDGSGTTAVVALARYFAQRGTPERTLLFAAFTAEEAGGYGSRYFSRQLDPGQIVAMFNIEMIGKPSASGPNTAWITGFDRSDFGEILQRAVEGTDYEFYADPYSSFDLFYRSDNATLARLGVPAHSISTTPIDVDRDYHQVTDEVETLDLEHMTNTIRAIAAGAATIVSGAATPTRIDPQTVD